MGATSERQLLCAPAYRRLFAHLTRDAISVFVHDFFSSSCTRSISDVTCRSSVLMVVSVFCLYCSNSRCNWRYAAVSVAGSAAAAGVVDGTAGGVASGGLGIAAGAAAGAATVTGGFSGSFSLAGGGALAASPGMRTRRYDCLAAREHRRFLKLSLLVSAVACGCSDSSDALGEVLTKPARSVKSSVAALRFNKWYNVSDSAGR